MEDAPELAVLSPAPLGPGAEAGASSSEESSFMAFRSWSNRPEEMFYKYFKLKRCEAVVRVLNPCSLILIKNIEDIVGVIFLMGVVGWM